MSDPGWKAAVTLPASFEEEQAADSGRLLTVTKQEAAANSSGHSVDAATTAVFFCLPELGIISSLKAGQRSAGEGCPPLPLWLNAAKHSLASFE